MSRPPSEAERIPHYRILSRRLPLLHAPLTVEALAGVQNWQLDGNPILLKPGELPMLGLHHFEGSIWTEH